MENMCQRDTQTREFCLDKKKMFVLKNILKLGNMKWKSILVAVVVVEVEISFLEKFEKIPRKVLC